MDRRSPTLDAAPAPARLGALDGLRLMAAMWVAAFHLALLRGDAPSGLTETIALKGYLGVDIFFVLSGFVMSYAYGAQAIDGRLDRARFYWARLARIYPLHLLTLAAAAALAANGLVLSEAVAADFFTIEATLSNLLLVQEWGVVDAPSWNFVAWSLSAEWLAYLVFPLLVAPIARVAERPARAIALGAAAIIAFAALAGSMQRTDGRVFDLSNQLVIHRIAVEFLIGMLTYRLCAAGAGASARVARYGASVLCAALLMVLAIDWGRLGAVQDALFVVGAAALICALSTGAGPLERTLAHPAMRYGGRVSYAFYLWHGVVHTAVLASARAEVDGDGAWRAFITSDAIGDRALLTIGFFAITGVLAVASHHLVEEPCRRAMLRLAARRFRATAGAVA